MPLYLLRKCIHLEDNDAAETILDQVADTKLTIQDLTRVADDITHLKDIQAALMGVLQLSNWKEAEKRYPEHTQREVLLRTFGKVRIS